MRPNTLRHAFYLLATGSFLFGGSCINGAQLQGALSDSVIALIVSVFTALAEGAIGSVVQI